MFQKPKKVTRVWGREERRGFVFVFVLMGPVVVPAGGGSFLIIVMPQNVPWGAGGGRIRFVPFFPNVLRSTKLLLASPASGIEVVRTIP